MKYHNIIILCRVMVKSLVGGEVLLFLLHPLLLVERDELLLQCW